LPKPRGSGKNQGENEKVVRMGQWEEAE